MLAPIFGADVAENPTFSIDPLLMAKIEERHLHVLAKLGTQLEDLPEANLLQKSDFIPAVQQGPLCVFNLDLTEFGLFNSAKPGTSLPWICVGLEKSSCLNSPK